MAQPKPGLFAKGQQFVAHVLPAIMRPLRILWNEIIGFLFIALAVMAVPQGIRTAREYDGDVESIFKVLLIAVFVLIMGGYGISSFRRARKASRS
ncbi:MAG: hypothetical protein IPM24_15770 [Bryobacterales bacterium]|nr:hypothetical protein [Bryobacterales bacterium]